MSETRPTGVEERQLEFGCERCGVQPGDWCRAVYLHSTRFHQATEAGRLPIPDRESAPAATPAGGEDRV